MPDDVKPPPLVDGFQRRVTHLLTDVLKADEVSDGGDGDITFRFQGGFFVVRFDEEDPSFISLRHPSFYDVNTRVPKPLVYRACLETCLRIKLAKVFPVTRKDGSEGIYSVIEFTAETPEQLNEQVLRRYLRTIYASERRFFELLADPDVRASAKETAAVEPASAVRH